MDGVVALAADGGLWLWRFEQMGITGLKSFCRCWNSRKPQFLGNIFGKSD